MKAIIVFIGLVLLCSLCLLPLNSQDLCQVKRLTFDNARQGFPSWSPDGMSVVYQHTDMSDTTGKNGLWKISVDGKNKEQIFSGVSEHPKWSPDGRYIIFDADTGRNIKLIPSEGGEAFLFLPDTIHIERGGMPCWSPDASQIAFLEFSNLSICIYDFLTGKINCIYKKEGMVPLPGCWTNDGQNVLIALMDLNSRKSTIQKISSDGNKREAISGQTNNFYRHLAISPDDSLLIFSSLEEKHLEFYIMSVNGGNSLPLPVLPEGHKEGQSWSPDGGKIAFSNSSSQEGGIWIMDVNIDQIKKALQSINK